MSPAGPLPRGSHRSAQREGVPDPSAGPLTRGSQHSPFSWPLRVYWEDTDAGGVVFYANYLKFFERARTEWLRAAGFEQQALRQSTGGMFVVVAASLHYHRPARLDDQLLVSTWIQDGGRAWLTIAQQAHLGPVPGGALLCAATIRIGWVDGNSFKPARIPPSILKALS